MIWFSEIESIRFGKNIFRCKENVFEINTLRKEVEENNVDILILRLPTQTLFSHYKLAEIGYRVLHADSLLYYKSDFQTINSIQNNLVFEKIEPSNSSVLDRIIPIIFANYQNHYYANPLLNKKKINDGYIEWAKSYINDTEDKIAWIVKEKYSKDENIVAFATCSYDKYKKECEGVLYGVMPTYSGRGIYSDLIRYTQSYFQQKYYKTMLVSTQLQNYTVQKVWVREGFCLYNSYETYHLINPKLLQ